MDYLLVALIVLAAALVQSLSGFGSALVAMPLLLPMLPVRATALMALVSGTLQVALLVRYRRALRISAVWRLALASVVAVPVGTMLLEVVPPRAAFAALGAILLAYAVYALTGPRLPELRHEAWAYGTGFAAGLLGGAYATSGPPVVVYASCRRWSPEEFRGNLQGFFLLGNAMVLISHGLAGHVDLTVFKHYLAALPGLAAGVAGGLYLTRFVKPGIFRKIVLVLLIVLGAQLLLRAAFEARGRAGEERSVRSARP